MKTVFVGAVEGSLRALEALCEAGRAPAMVVTLPPEAAQRHSDYADLGEAARAREIALHLTRDINGGDALARLGAVSPDLILMIGWSQICRAPTRALPRLGMMGFHPAPLPALRGRAAIPWTLLAGLRETAASLFWIDEGCDSGDLVMQSWFQVAADETARSLYDKHLDALCAMLPEALDQIERGEEARVPQDHACASYCARRTPEDGRIDWTRPAAEVALLVRAVGEPYPGAFTTYRDGRIVIDAARVHEGPPAYFGLPGQVQEIGPDTMRVSCGGYTCLDVTVWRSDGRAPARHAVLGREARA